MSNIANRLSSSVEIIGYVARIVLSNETPNWETVPFIIQSLLLILAPALFAATLYMEFGRIVRLVHGQEACVIKTTKLTKIFVTGDVVSFLIQGIGMEISLHRDRFETHADFVKPQVVVLRLAESLEVEPTDLTSSSVD